MTHPKPKLLHARDATTSYAREHLVAATRRALEGGDRMAGYALVVWDKQGDARSWVCHGGPVGYGFIPAYTHDALNRHAAIEIAVAMAKAPEPPPDGA